MRRIPVAAASLFTLLVVVPAWAQPVIDGTRDLEYGTATAVQTVETGFGDNFSELDAAYAACDGGQLSLMLTGNVEANFNRLDIFIDSKAGGQATFDSSGNDNANVMDGLQFDVGFAADYHLIVRRGTAVANPKLDLDFADLVAQSASGYFDIMSGGGLDGTGSTGTGVNASAILVGYDNSNVAGVTGGTAAANPAAAAAVTTGLELGIALTDLDPDGSQPIRVMVGQNNVDHNFWSNQFLAGLVPPQGNLGGNGTGGFTGEGAIDFTLFAGDQFFIACEAAPSVVEVPAVTPGGMIAIALLLAAAAVHALRRI
jgi:hypothetical protein